jgi:NAD(P)-dependent dehydrogenase (short-subunit alcohol dehydrogenase family)
MGVCAVDLNGEAAAATAASFGGQYVAADVSDPFALETAFAECLHHFGRLDVAHLNAGVSLASGDIGLLDIVNYRRSLEVNIDHVVFGTGLAVQAMRAGTQDEGPRAVIATSSMAGIDPFLPNAIYTLTKHAVVGFIRALAPDLAAEGIGAHVICPGLTDTAQIPPGRRELLLEAGMPLIEVDRVADAVLSAIASPLEATGSCWIVNPDQEPFPWSFADVPGPHHLINVPNKR